MTTSPYIVSARQATPMSHRPVGQIYLPRQDSTSLEFMKAVFTGQKQVIRSQEVPHVHVPAYPELSMGKLWDFAASCKDIAPYLPDIPGHQRKMPDRQFFYGIIAARTPEILHTMIVEAHEKRYRAKLARQEEMLPV